MFPRLRGQETFVAETFFCFRETKNVSDFFQKHFVFSTNVSPFARRGNNVSATVFPQQCFLVCGGLYRSPRPDLFETSSCSTQGVGSPKRFLVIATKRWQIDLSRLCSATFQQLFTFGATFCSYSNVLRPSLILPF